MKIWRALRPSALVITVYALVCAAWSAFAFGVAPEIIAGAGGGRGGPILDRVFQGRRSLPVEHYLGAWRGIAAAVLIAMALHLAIALLATRIDRLQPRGARVGGKIEASGALMVFSAVFLATAVITRIAGDHRIYVAVWTSILQGRDPWYRGVHSLNAYGPLFNALAPMTLLSPLTNKLLFAFGYLAYVVWLIKAFAPRRDVQPPSWFWLGLLIFNLYPWEQIAWYGFFDILVGLACVACVHSLAVRKDGLSGAYLASGILLKFLPVVMLPFVAFDGRRLNVRMVGVCVALAGLGFGASVLLWGASTFAPIFLAAMREPYWSIYNLMNSNYSSLIPSTGATDVGWVQRSLSAAAMLALVVWWTRRRIGPLLSSILAVLVTLLFYSVAGANYQMTLFCLVSYWAASEWSSLQQRPLLVLFLIGYFNWMALSDLYYWERAWRAVIPANFVLLFQFLLGCLLLAALIRFPVAPDRRRA